MHHSRIAAFLLGAWICGNLLVAWFGTQGFEIAGDTLKSPPQEMSRMLDKLGSGSAHQLMRHEAAEWKRSIFADWELAQIAIGFLLASVLFLGVRSTLLTGLTGLMLLITIFERLKITPELTWLGRSIDFIPWTAESLPRDQFWRLHTVYIVMEGAKLALALGSAGLLFAIRRRPRTRVKVDAVDHPHHRHVDR